MMIGPRLARHPAGRDWEKSSLTLPSWRDGPPNAIELKTANKNVPRMSLYLRLENRGGLPRVNPFSLAGSLTTSEESTVFHRRPKALDSCRPSPA